MINKRNRSADILEIKIKDLIINTKKTLIMGILNLTPDSFSDGGHFFSLDKALKHTESMIKAGADIIDVGAESSRPGSIPIDVHQESNRLDAFFKKYAYYFDTVLSLDTYKASIARMGLDLGVDIINDITGLGDPDMLKVLNDYQCPIIIMHKQGNPKTMQESPYYDHVLTQIYIFFQNILTLIPKNYPVILDPGIGFGKRLKDNLLILKKITFFSQLNKPLLLGCSRKSMFQLITSASVDDRLSETLATVSWATQNRVSIVRVHDVREAKKVVLTIQAIIDSECIQ